MAEITVKKGSVLLTANRSDLLEVSETHDGVSFVFKGGVQFYFSDNYFPSEAKQLISRTANAFGKNKLIFDLDNLRKPVMVDAT
jgi:hypothetical protein